MTPLNLKTALILTLTSFSIFALEPYQGEDYKLESHMCGAPLVEALRKKDPENLLNDPTGNLMLKKSLEEISESNLHRLRSKLGALREHEKQLLELIRTKYPAPIIHRTSNETSKIILTSKVGMVSATKRGADPRVTPMIEQHLFGGHDCIFTSVASPFGIQQYGNVIFRFEDKKGFAWGSLYTGYRWALEVEKKDLTKVPESDMKRRFATQIFTNNHWDEALGLLIIENVRSGTSFRGKGESYDKATIISKLLTEKDQLSFWRRVVRHRLAFLEGHFTDIVPRKHIDFVQYRLSDKNLTQSWGFPEGWFTGEDPFIQYFNRDI